MKKEIIINASSSEVRIAILEEGSLLELYVEQPENERMVGDIYKGRVENVVEAVQAAFVNIGMEQNGFLPFADVGSELREYSALTETVVRTPPPGKRRSGKKRPSRPLLKPKQEILVQITKEPIASKGARLTTAISLPGRFLVLVPHDQHVGVSRKIEDAKERRRLRMLAKSLKPEGFGLIIRTVAVGKDAAALKNDLDTLLKIWKRIEDKARAEKGSKLLHKDMGMASSVIRDLFSPDIDRLVVDNRKLYGEIQRYLKDVSSNLMPRLELYKKTTPVFDAHKIEEQIEKSLSRQIWMKGGGHIIFDQVEAMVVVDVNSGRSISHKDHEINALKTDLEAAREIARQLRLRDYGGIVVIDFIDLRDDKNRKKVVMELKKELKKDRAAFDILPMNDFGLVSLTRQRVRPSLLFRVSEPCPRCKGLGMVPTKGTIANRIERRIQHVKSKTGHRRLVLKAHPDVIRYMTEGFRSRLRRLAFKYLVTVRVEKDPDRLDDNFEIIPYKEAKKL